jgi:hypothetical protein
MDEKALKEAWEAAEKVLIENQKTDLDYGVRQGDGPIAPWPSQPCKLIFLDFDGVLNSDLSVSQLGTRYKFWPASVKALNQLLSVSGALIVISSTWREHWTLKENAASLERAGLLRGRVVGKTCVSEGARGRQVDSWLKSAPYPVESFVILDDKDDMEMHRERLVQVDPSVGLGVEEGHRAAELLNRPWRPKAAT